jgi:hypothetical protein
MCEFCATDLTLSRGDFGGQTLSAFSQKILFFNVFFGVWLVAGARFELRKPSGGWVRVKVMSLKLIKD